MFSICLFPTAGLRSRRKNDTASSPELFFHEHGSSTGAHGFHVCGSCSGAVAILELESVEATTGPRKCRGPNINVSPTWWLLVVMNINLMWLTLSNPTQACEYRQNRRQMVFNRGDLRLCRGVWHSKNWKKLHWFSILYFNLRGLGALFGWLNPRKLPPWRRDWISINIWPSVIVH